MPTPAPTRLTAALRGRRVLVTGHTGFKGAWLCAWLLREGAHVSGLALDAPTTPALFDALGLASHIDDTRADVRDADALARHVERLRPELIVHMAAQSLVRASYAAPMETFAINTQGTANLLEAVRKAARPACVLVVTSDKCYRPSPTPHAHDEADPLGGDDPYSASKAGAEIVTHAYRHSFFHPARIAQHGVLLASVRAGNVIGGGDFAVDRLLPDAARALSARQPVPVRNPRAIRPWQHVLDALSGYLALSATMLTAGPTRAAELASAWNFGPDDAPAPTGAAPSPRDERLSAQRVVERFIHHWGSGSWRDASDPSAPHEAPHLGLSIARAKRDLAWTPTWGVDEALRASATWYRRVLVEGHSAQAVCHEQLDAFVRDATARSIAWAGAPERP
jgi:CDP-glucose 4,6-dehydratase